MTVQNIQKSFNRAIAIACGNLGDMATFAAQPPSCNTGAKKNVPPLREKKNSTPEPSEPENSGENEIPQSDEDEAEKPRRNRKKMDQTERDERDDEHKAPPLAIDMEKIRSVDDLSRAFVYDWFQGTIWSPSTRRGQYDPQDKSEERAAAVMLIGVLLKMGLMPNYEGAGGQNGYRASVPFFKRHGSREMLANISHASPKAMPNVTFFGGKKGECQQNVDAFKRAGIPILLSRADVRIDLTAPGLFEDLVDRLIKYEIEKCGDDLDSKRTTFRLIDGGRRGKTLYLGAPGSRFMLRIYQKDLQRASAGEIKFADADPDLFRIEGQFRPASKDKFSYAAMSADEMARSNPTMRRVIKTLGELIKIHGDLRIVKSREIARERTFRTSADHGMNQYGMIFARAALADLIDEQAVNVEWQIKLDQELVAGISESDIHERMLDDFRSAIRSADYTSRAIKEAGLDLSDMSTEDIALQIIKSSEKTAEKALRNKLAGLMSTAELLVEMNLSDEAEKICREIVNISYEISGFEEFIESRGYNDLMGSMLVAPFLITMDEFIKGEYFLDEGVLVTLEPSDPIPISAEDEQELNDMLSGNWEKLPKYSGFDARFNL